TMRNCLICEVPITECHLGIDSCRACCVFYKRTRKLDKELLKCTTGMDDCIELDPKTSCRKCRFRKFTYVLTKSSNPVSVKDEIESDSDLEKQLGPSTSFLDHDSFTLMTAPPSATPLLDRIKNGYGFVCASRKTGEVPLIPSDFIPTQEKIENADKHFFPITYDKIIPTAKIYLSALFDFGSAVFHDYRSLTDKDKSAIITSSFKHIVALDLAYRSANYFPDCDTRLVSYIFTARNNDIDAFLDTCPNEINKEEISKAFRLNSKKLISMKEDLKRFAPTDDEFALLYGLSFWSSEVSLTCEEMTVMVEMNRKSIMEELHTVYKQQGRRDYAARLGELMCVLSNIEEISTLHQTNLELYKLMNIFDF
ncbi:hypothetical protein PMAYCL1PPCAC_09947, partial [Pristionchus mayeri]